MPVKRIFCKWKKKKKTQKRNCRISAYFFFGVQERIASAITMEEHWLNSFRLRLGLLENILWSWKIVMHDCSYDSSWIKSVINPEVEHRRRKWIGSCRVHVTKDQTGRAICGMADFLHMKKAWGLRSLEKTEILREMPKSELDKELLSLPFCEWTEDS